ncbi:MAG: hypothetical protein AAF800_10850 [Planctomycetota bacterium]
MLLRTTLLRHVAPPPTGPHFDWLIASPPGPRRGADPPAGLWTARVARPWTDWPRLGRFDLTPLPPHRVRYLDWAGPLTAGRGHVYPAAHGHVLPRLWTPHRLELELLTPRLTARLHLRLDRRGDVWSATAGFPRRVADAAAS